MWTGLSVSRVAASIGKTAFFAPDIEISPVNAFPPLMCSFSIKFLLSDSHPCCDAHPSQLSLQSKQALNELVKACFFNFNGKILTKLLQHTHPIYPQIKDFPRLIATNQ